MFATIRASDLRCRYFRMLVVGIARFLLPSIRILLLGLRASYKGMEIDCSCRITLSYALAKKAGDNDMLDWGNGETRNIVSTINLDCKLSLKTIALQARNAEDNPKRFAAIIRRIGEPKTTTLKFASGKMVCTVAKSEHQLKLAAVKYARIIQKLGFPARSKDFKIQNIVGSCDVKFPTRLEGLAYKHSQFSSVRDDTYRAFENIHPVLTEYRKIQQCSGR